MNSSINFNTIGSGLKNGFNRAVDASSVWMGHCVVMIKAGYETALPYLQNKWVAAISLFAVTLLLIELGQLFVRYARKCYPDDAAGKTTYNHVIDITLGMGTICAGVFAFSKYGKLPLNALTIIVISCLAVPVGASFHQ